MASPMRNRSLSRLLFGTTLVAALLPAGLLGAWLVLDASGTGAAPDDPGTNRAVAEAVAVRDALERWLGDQERILRAWGEAPSVVEGVRHAAVEHHELGYTEQTPEEVNALLGAQAPSRARGGGRGVSHRASRALRCLGAGALQRRVRLHGRGGGTRRGLRADRRALVAGGLVPGPLRRPHRVRRERGRLRAAARPADRGSGDERGGRGHRRDHRGERHPVVHRRLHARKEAAASGS